MTNDDPVIDLLQRTPDDIPEFPGNLEGVQRRARARGRRRVAAGAVVAVALLAAAGTSLALLSRIGRNVTPNATPSTTPNGTPAETPGATSVALLDEMTVKVHGAVALANGEDSVWVSGFGEVTRIRLTGGMAQQVETPGVEDFSRVAVGEGAVWVTADGGRVYRIDPATNHVVATITVGTTVGDVAAGGGDIWVAEPEAGRVVRIDPATNQVSGEGVSLESPGQLLVAFGSLWVERTSPAPASVVKVDPTTGSITDFPRCCRFRADAQSMWFLSEDAVTRADPTTGEILATFPIPRALDLALTDGRVYVVASPESSDPTLFYPIEGTAQIWQIDPATNRTMGGPLSFDALQPTAVAADPTWAWVADYDGQVVYRFRFDGAAPLPVPHGFQAKTGPGMWALIEADRRGAWISVLSGDCLQVDHIDVQQKGSDLLVTVVNQGLDPSEGFGCRLYLSSERHFVLFPHPLAPDGHVLGACEPDDATPEGRQCQSIRELGRTP